MAKRFLIFLAMIFLGSWSQAATVLSQTVGSVGEDIVSSRDVQIQAALERLLFPGKEKMTAVIEETKRDAKVKKKEKTKSVIRASLYEILPKEAHFSNELTATLLEIVIEKEAESFKVAQPTEDEIKEALEKAEKSVSGQAYWSTLEVDAKEFKAVVKRKLTAKKFIKIKTDLMTALVTDQDALNYYEKNRIKFGQLPFSNFKENIKTFLAQQQIDERLKTLFEVIKRKYKVRNYAAEGRSFH